MPEGPEVKLIAEELNQLIQHRYLTGYYHIKTGEQKFAPLLIHNVTSRGKRILINFGDYTLVSFLAMTGRWQLIPDEKHTKARLTVETSDAKFEVYYNDYRFGSNIILHNTNVEAHLAKKASQCLLRDPPTLQVWLDKWRAYIKRFPRKHICQAFMDQLLFSGVGNYLKAEILYDVGILPTRLLPNLSDSDLVALREATLRIITQSYENGGTTIEMYLRPSGERGNYQNFLKMYGRKICPNGHPVKKEETKDGRKSHWCEVCQR